MIQCNPDSIDCRLLKTEIIRKQNDFRRILHKGSHIKGSALSFIITGSDRKQVGFIVPKRIIRKAVERNRIKRWLRGIYRHNRGLVSTCQLLLMIKKRPAGYQALESEFKQLAKKTVSLK